MSVINIKSQTKNLIRGLRGVNLGLSASERRAYARKIWEQYRRWGRQSFVRSYAN